MLSWVRQGLGPVPRGGRPSLRFVKAAAAARPDALREGPCGGSLGAVSPF